MKRYLCLSFLAVGILAAVLWYGRAFTLPHPTDSNRAQLLFWLAASDLSEESLEVTNALARRFHEELVAGWKPLSETSRTAAISTRLSENFDILSHRWFLVKAMQYADIPADERKNYLHENVGMVMTLVELGDGLAPRDAGVKKTAFSQWLDKIQSWIDLAPKEERAQLTQAYEAGVLFWLATHSIDTLPSSAHQSVSHRIAATLDGNTSVGSATFELDAGEQEQLQTNGWQLLKAWFLEQVAVVAKQAKETRGQYIANQLSRMQGWNVQRFLRAHPSERQPSTLEKMAQLNRVLLEMRQWVRDAPLDQQPLAEEVLRELMAQLPALMMETSSS